MDKRHPPFFNLFELSHSEDLGLMSVPYLLLKSLEVPSFPSFVLGTPDSLSLIFLFEHQSLQPFFSLEIEYGIDVESLDLESPLF